MRKIKGITATVLSCAMLFGMAAYADSAVSINAVPDTKSGSVEVSGVMPSGNSDYTVMILKPGAKADGITSENFGEKVNFIMSGKTDENGVFSIICYPLDEWSFDDQQVVVSGAASGSTTFFFLSTTLEETVVGAVNEASADDIAKLLSNEALIEGRELREYLGIDLSEYEGLIDKGVVHSAVVEESFTSVKGISDKILEAVGKQKEKEDAEKEERELLNSIKNSTDNELDEVIRNNAGTLFPDITRAYGYEYLMKLYAEGDKAPIQSVFTKLRALNKLSEANSVFEEAVIVASVNYADRQIADDVLGEYDDEIGIDINKLSKLSESKRANLISDMAKKSFNSISDIKKEYDALYDKYSKKSTGTTSGGGSSGGGGGSSFSGGAALPLTTEKTPAETVTVKFNDMESAKWAEESVEYLLKKGIVNGYPDGSFKPGKAVTREEFATMLVSALGLYSKESSCSFSDVLPGSWYYNYVASAYEAGVVNGIDEESFGVGESITREQAAAMIYRAATVCGKIFSGDMEFADGDFIAEYAKEAVGKISGVIINGDESGCFNPKEVTTRAQAARMIHQLMITG